MADVAILLGAGTARVAGRSYVIAPGEGGSVTLADGPTLRPLRFGERGALARLALAAPSPAEELAQAVLAVSSSGGPDHPAAAAIALHMAGAGGTDLGFAAAQSLLARQLGWTAEDIAQAPAAEVDALAADWQQSLQAGPSGWTRILLAEPVAGEGDDPVAVALSLAQDLLRRVNAGIDAEALPPMTHQQPLGQPHEAPAARSDGRSGSALASVIRPRPVTGGAEAEAQSPTRTAAPSSLDHLPRTVQKELRSQDIVPGTNETQAANCEDRSLVSAGSTLHPAPAVANPTQYFRPMTADSKPDPGPVAASPTSHSGPITADPLAQARQVAATPTPHPAPQSAAVPDIWGRRPSLAVTARAARQQAKAQPKEALAPRAFAGWFDDAPPRPDRTRPDIPDPAPWVWAKTEPRHVPTPDLPEAQPLSRTDDPTEALADALHLAADLRGIAP